MASGSRILSFGMALVLCATVFAQAPSQPAPSPGGPPPGFVLRDPYAGHKKVLVIGDLRTGASNPHDGVSHAMAVLERIGRDSGVYIAFLHTETGNVTKGEVWGKFDYAKGGSKQARGHNLDYFDAIVFYTNGETDMTPDQKKDLLSFIHDDGKGFVGIHTATATAYTWPEYADMIGGIFDNHPWNIVEATVLVEQPDNPIMRGLGPSFRIADEMYQMKAVPYSRDKVDVLARLDVSTLDMKNPGVHRTDGDFPVAWTKTFGKGRVFYSGLGHAEQAWDDLRIQGMYLEAIKWVLGMTDAPVKPHPLPTSGR